MVQCVQLTHLASLRNVFPKRSFKNPVRSKLQTIAVILQVGMVYQIVKA